MPVAGIDIGSRSIKAAVMDKGRLLSSCANDSILKGEEAAMETLSEAIRLAGLSENDIERVMATGYGRFQFAVNQEHMSEISCHARGIHWYFPEVRTILDIGGQDLKAINCNEKGRLTNFILNNKCAGGTGRFLEVIADLLGVQIDALAEISKKSTRDISLSTVCVVFAKTEVLNMLREGVDKSDIVAGLYNSIATVVSSMLHKIHMIPDFSITGGVARNKAIVEAIGKKTGLPPFIAPQPHLIGAIGAALFAEDQLEK